MNRTRLVIYLGVFVLGIFTVQSQKLKPVFNGEDFKNWKLPENNIWWTVKNGVMEAQSGPDRKGSILWTKKKFKDFVFKTDFLFGKGTVDSGVFLRTDKQQIQLGISGSLKRDMTGSPYIPGKGYPVEAVNVKRLLKQSDWNTMEIHVKGALYKVYLNGESVLEYLSEQVPEKGPIGLQLHPERDMKISFKNISLVRL